jgi:hypothetical protein
MSQCSKRAYEWFVVRVFSSGLTRAHLKMQTDFDITASSHVVTEISREELREGLLNASLTVVDVLPPESYAMGHIPGAINLPLESIASIAHELLPDLHTDIIVYCGKFT